MNRRLELVVAVIMFGILGTACADKSAVAPSAVALPTSSPGAFSARVTCEVTVPTATMTCGPAPVAATSGIRAARNGIDRNYVTVGGPGTYVYLSSSGTSNNLNSGVLTSEVTLTNLTTQLMNTPDSTTVDTGGVKVFFVDGPTVTSGEGTVTVEGDGVGTFTASNQPYYEYNAGAILVPGETTSPRLWTFDYTGAVTFTFDCYVYTQTPGSTGTLRSFVFYVVNSGTPSVTVYGVGATGDAFPFGGTVAGSATVLDRPSGIALDASGNIYVVNDSDNINYSSITVYGQGSTGDPMPVDTITGNNTGLADPQAIAVDGLGWLYVINGIGNSITVYRPGARGNVAPKVTIQGGNTHLSAPLGIAVDGAGYVYVAGGYDTVTEYIPMTGLSGTADLAPTRMIAGNNTGLNGAGPIAVDGAGNIYVINGGGAYTVTIYGPSVTGNEAPTNTIAGSNTGMTVPKGLALDPWSGNIYVVNAFGGTGSVGSITVYAAGVFGNNVAPINTITGTFTGLNYPNAIAF